MLTLPLGWKWELGVARVAITVTVLAAFAGVAVVGLGSEGVLATALIGVLALAGAAAILTYRFYRDPDRRPPDGEVVVSPADGKVIYVREARDGIVPVSTKHGRDYALAELTGTELENRDVIVIGIAMSFLDVHVNRAPIAGRIRVQHRSPGVFGSLKHFEMTLRNERLTTLIERDGLEVGVVQIASRLVRQIVSFVREGDQVVLGQRIGVIRLGSQVDVLLPAREVRANVHPGDRLRAGESILAVIVERPVPPLAANEAQTVEAI